MTPEKVEKLFKALKNNNPSPETELAYSTPFELLAAVVMSAQMTDVGVNRATEKLFPVANTPEQFLALGEEGLKAYIKSINYNNTKARNLIKASQMLVDQHQGQVPENRESLEALPGVGRKTANVILNVAFGQPTIAVDTHIFRVSNRTGLTVGKTPLDIEKGLLEVVPQKFLHDAHHWLVLHGRYVCLARKPKCDECVIREYCEFGEKI